MDENVASVETTETEQSVSMEELQAELERLRTENGKLKNAQSNASADASKYKKELQARMSEQERAAAETKELIESLKAENAMMKRNQTLAEQRAGFLGLGFSTDLAAQAAEATADNNFASLMTTMQKFIIEHDKALQADALRSTPRPGAGATEQPTVTPEQFAKMKYVDRVKLYEEQPELYQELTK